ncbi:nucleobase:cation symporter-2 family protein [Paenarthrobacter sp. NPDC018779]|uniref:nucleobase:cation symporter-2 family protein n=1 Tax=Paenarthrobacter sp. NPDC018779 TaxID=3364375 RepID=UPI0037C97F92
MSATQHPGTEKDPTAPPAPTVARNAVDEIPPRGRMIFLSLQHLLTFYATVLVLPIIIAAGIGLSKPDTVVLLGAVVLVSGIGTIIQSVGVWKIGIRQPLVLGGSAVVIGPTIAIANANGAGSTGLLAVFGASIVAGAVVFALSPLYGKLLRLLPPVVTGCVIAMVGFSLLPITVNLMGGGNPTAPDFASPANLTIAGTTLLVILVLFRFGRGLLKSLAIFIGLIAGTVTGAAVGVVDFSGIADANWFDVVRPFHFGLPTFEIGAIISMTVAILIVGVECTSSYFAMGEIVGRKPLGKDVQRGIAAEGLSAMIAGIFSAVPPTTFNGNVGLVRASGVKSRWVVALTGVLMLIVSCLPKIAAVVSILPTPAVGAALLTLFGIIATVGIQTLAKVELTNDKNLIIIAISLGVGFIPSSSATFFHTAPESIQMVLQSGIVLTAIVAILLNLAFNGFTSKADVEHEMEETPPA